MESNLRELFEANAGAVTVPEIYAVASRGVMRGLVRRGEIVALWHGVYTDRLPTINVKLAGLTKVYGQEVTACRSSAAAIYGFDTEGVVDVHILDPGARHVHGHKGLVVHQQLDAPIQRVGAQLVTAPAWTAVEVARTLPRPRALATLDAALATKLCTVDDLTAAADAQSGRRGMAHVRPLIRVADGRAGSPMESETRLVILDADLPKPDLQLPIVDNWGIERFYLDFAWEAAKLGAEYDSDDFHTGPRAVRRDKVRIAWLQEHGWLIVPITVDDVRRWPSQLVRRLSKHLEERTPVCAAS
ncbi:endonuclease domain-containing protein [Antrihabitans sp. YC2-6]|uniref:endonuclease domain-containing protein n=1 Tax=Antrihabitans sp. YC2-6 TaxID=2799498 RepID=UPI0018F4E527|nr:hypothetical protein [Antrihabitans sp. YC2-6]MBJ8343616.1 hypothetical protein [Antrihabitans sp. YC2-6]